MAEPTLDPEQSQAEFETTSWTLVEALREPDHPHKREAEEVLLRRYWPPVYAWFRHKGFDRVRASDVTQRFFLEVVLRRELFVRADARRARLRSLLFKALEDYSVDEHRREAGAREAFLPPEALEREDERLGRASQELPQRLFDLRWAEVQLDEALQQCEQHYAAVGRLDYWKAFEARVLLPAVSGNRPRDMTDLARELGFTDEAHVAVAVYAVRNRCMALLRQIVGRTAIDPAEQEAEFNFVVSLFS